MTGRNQMKATMQSSEREREKMLKSGEISGPWRGWNKLREKSPLLCVLEPMTIHVLTPSIFAVLSFPSSMHPWNLSRRSNTIFPRLTHGNPFQRSIFLLNHGQTDLTCACVQSAHESHARNQICMHLTYQYHVYWFPDHTALRHLSGKAAGIYSQPLLGQATYLQKASSS